MDSNNINYWQNRYLDKQTGWDLGVVSPPLKAYFDQLSNKDIKILIPGAGNAYEAEYLHQQGFTQVYILDWAEEALNNFLKRVPEFPPEHLLALDFFDLEMQFDLVIEQTFFCAITPDLRVKYRDKMHTILSDNGKIAGLLFQIPLNENHPPFGGCKEDYIPLFEEKFTIKTMETAHNSIPPRANNELFVILQKKD